MNIFRASKGESRIIKDERALLPDFLPAELPGRGREIRELVLCLSPIAQNRQPDHALLIGPPGTGKTTVARHVLSQLNEYSQRPLTIYINCWEKQSRFAVLSAIADAVGEMLPRRGIAADEIFSRIVEIAKKEERVPVVVLDEVDRLVAEEGGVQVLYDLCRAGETHSLKTSVIAITNDEEFHIKLEARVRSSFIQHVLKFSPYTVPQIKEILAERAKLAFFEGALSDDVVPLCSAIAFKQGGDARIALSLLLSAAKSAELEGAQRVEVNHVRAKQEETLNSSAAIKAERKKEEMDEVDQKLIDVVRAAGEAGIESGKLYKRLSRYSGERALRDRVERLLQSGVLTADELSLGQGRTRVIKVK